MRYLKKWLKGFVSALFIINSSWVSGCTLFIANDGQHVWIGNNEDGLQDLTYRIWFYPPERNQYGYSIWTELPRHNLFNGLSYLNPQGGMNEHGLFMDYTAIDRIAVQKDDDKKNRKKQVVTDILRKCRTVEEALAYLKKYNLVRLNDAQLFIADASGDYVTVTGAYVVRKSSNNFALTNYCINGGHYEACHRRDVATHYMESGKKFDLDAIKNILAKSAQRLPNNLMSNYSMAVDLKTATIHLFYKNDFTTEATISLRKELGEKKHHREIEALFPKSIEPVLKIEFTKNGIDAAIMRYTELRNSGRTEFNFRNDDALNFAISLISKEKIPDAITLLKCLLGFDPERQDIAAWLALAYRKAGNLMESEKIFGVVLEKEPNDYLVNLFGRQDNGVVVFKLPDFEEAKNVYLMGEFSEWTKRPIPMKKINGSWNCSVTLPKGVVRYKFIVNDQYLADSRNFLHTGQGPDIYSLVFVW